MLSGRFNVCVVPKKGKFAILRHYALGDLKCLFDGSRDR